MSRWFRHYAGLCRDDKLVSAAIKAKQPVERVVWVWCAILESAAEIDDNGRYELDAAEVAYFLRADEADIVSVVECLGLMGRLDAGSVAKWCDRQFQSDRSAERQKRYRDKRKQAQGDGSDRNAEDAVTSPSRHRDAPEAETETEEETEDAASAASSASAPAFDLEEAERCCREAAGSDRLGSFAPIAELLHRQADLDRDVLPAIRSRPAGPNGIKSWRYYAPIIAEAMLKREPRAPSVASTGPPKVHVMSGTPEWDAWVAHEGKSHPADAKGGWYFPTRWPPATPNTGRDAA